MGGNSYLRTDAMEIIVVLRILGIINICLTVSEEGMGGKKKTEHSPGSVSSHVYSYDLK